MDSESGRRDRPREAHQAAPPPGTWSRSQSAVPTRLGSASSVWWPRCRQAGCWEGGTQRVMRNGRSQRGWQSPAPHTHGRGSSFPPPLGGSPAPSPEEAPPLASQGGSPSELHSRKSAPPCPQRKLRPAHLLPQRKLRLPPPTSASRVICGLTNPLPLYRGESCWSSFRFLSWGRPYLGRSGFPQAKELIVGDCGSQGPWCLRIPLVCSRKRRVKGHLTTATGLAGRSVSASPLFHPPGRPYTGKHLEGLKWACLCLSGISEQTKEETHPVFVSQVPSM